MEGPAGARMDPCARRREAPCRVTQKANTSYALESELCRGAARWRERRLRLRLIDEVRQAARDTDGGTDAAATPVATPAATPASGP